MASSDKHVVLEDVRMVFRNFAGAEKTFNRAGDRNFSIWLDAGQAERLSAEKWNVKMKPPREEGDEPFFHLPVKVDLETKNPPRIVMISSRGRNTLSAEMLPMMDFADFDTVDLIIRPYDWGPISGKYGRKAYLVAVYATLTETVLDLKYAKYREIGGEPEVFRPDDSGSVDPNDLDNIDY